MCVRVCVGVCGCVFVCELEIIANLMATSFHEN